MKRARHTLYLDRHCGNISEKTHYVEARASIFISSIWSCFVYLKLGRASIEQWAASKYYWHYIILSRETYVN